jgi:predicted nucleic acid-binding protein
MKKVFADTHYFIALLSQSDEDHTRAVSWTRNPTGFLVTTEWIMTELADGLSRSKRRGMFAQLRQRLLANPDYQVIPFDMSLCGEGVALYDSRSDKSWSLTDCVSFVVMQREGITEALTGDHHFEQAGFVALLK